jgi:hypothetical protein
MTVIVIQFDRASEDALFGDESLETVQFLLGHCYGPISRAEGDQPAPCGASSRQCSDARAWRFPEWSTRKDSFASQ